MNKLRNLFAALAVAFILLALSPVANAATSDTLNVRTSGVWEGKIEVREVVVDFSAHTTQTQNAITQLFTLPARSVVIGLSAQVLKAEGATCTAKVGTDAAGEAAVFLASLNLNSEAWTWIPSGVTGGKAISTATVLRLTHNNATHTAKVKFRLVIQIN